MPGNRRPGSRQSPRIIQQEGARAQVAAASAAAADSERSSLIEFNVQQLDERTDGLDLTSINATLEDHETRIDALENP